MLTFLTVVIPVKNDSSSLRLCLSNLVGASRVLVVGSGSHDTSEQVTEEFDVDYLAFHWDGKFPKKRNWVLHNYKFKTDWVLFLDADEYVTKAFMDEVATTLPETTHAGFWMNYNNHFMGKRLHYGDPCPKLALFRIGAGEYERIDEDSWSALDMEVHEHPVINGTLGEIKAPIDHQDYRGLAHWIRKHNEYSDWEARRYLRLKRHGESEWNNLTSRQKTKYRNLASWWFPYVYFLGSYFWKKGFLDGVTGFRISLMKSCYFYMIRIKAKELEMKSVGDDG